MSKKSRITLLVAAAVVLVAGILVCAALGGDDDKDAKAGGSVRFRMPAKLDGRFEVDLEDRKQELAEVTVE